MTRLGRPMPAKPGSLCGGHLFATQGRLGREPGWLKLLLDSRQPLGGGMVRPTLGDHPRRRDQEAQAVPILLFLRDAPEDDGTLLTDDPLSRLCDLACPVPLESQSTTSLASPTGQRLIHHSQQDIPILIFVRERSEGGGRTLP